MNFWIFRLDSLGSPFRNVNSGRKTEGDALNNRRMAIGTERYLEHFRRKTFSKNEKLMIF